MKSRTSLRLAIVEDHQATRDYLTALFGGSEGIAVVGAYANGRAALEGLRHTPADVLLADLGLPDIPGLEVIATVKERFPPVEIIVLTMHEGREHLLAAFRAGASGYLLKGAPAVEILAAVRTTVAGGSPLSARVARSVVEELRGGAPVSPAPLLTPREREVLRCLAAGLSEKELAAELAVSTHTVHTHIGKVYRKLGARSRTAALLRAREMGLIG